MQIKCVYSKRFYNKQRWKHQMNSKFFPCASSSKTHVEIKKRHCAVYSMHTWDTEELRTSYPQTVSEFCISWPNLPVFTEDSFAKIHNTSPLGVGNYTAQTLFTQKWSLMLTCGWVDGAQGILITLAFF